MSITPGQWIIGDHPADARRVHIYAALTGELLAAAYEMRDGSMEGNARAIAKAPVMVELLRHAVTQCGCPMRGVNHSPDCFVPAAERLLLEIGA